VTSKRIGTVAAPDAVGSGIACGLLMLTSSLGLLDDDPGGSG
jgi:hypothetical protein